MGCGLMKMNYIETIINWETLMLLLYKTFTHEMNVKYIYT